MDRKFSALLGMVMPPLAFVHGKEAANDTHSSLAIHRSRFLFFLLSLLILVFGLSVNSHGVGLAFEDLLEEGGLVFQPPTDFKKKPLHGAFSGFDQRLMHEDGTELLLLVRPLSRIEINYDDPHSAAPEPNSVYSMVFHAYLGRLSTRSNTPTREYSEEQANALFNADWAAAAIFDLTGPLAEEKKQGLLLAIHKDNKADVYCLFLFDDPQKETIDKGIAALSFSK